MSSITDLARSRLRGGVSVRDVRDIIKEAKKDGFTQGEQKELRGLLDTFGDKFTASGRKAFETFLQELPPPLLSDVDASHLLETVVKGGWVSAEERTQIEQAIDRFNPAGRSLLTNFLSSHKADSLAQRYSPACALLGDKLTPSQGDRALRDYSAKCAVY